MQERFLAYNIKKKLLNNKDIILCAVSGGVDSIVMVDLLLKGKYNIGIAHVNHKKRGEASDQDALFVENYCQTNGIPYFLMELEKTNAKVNFQEYAREERYKWFEKISLKYNYTKIATAHHLDDVVETFFINAMRGSGSAGLSSIKESRGKIVRPLLSFTKNEIIEYATNNNIQYREDSSNAQNDYLRNRIRNQLLPQINEIEDKGLSGLYKTAYIINDENELLKTLIQENRYKWISEKVDSIEIDIDNIKKIKGNLSLLHHLVDGYGFTFDQLENILWNAKTGSQFFTPNHVGLMDRGKLVVSKIDINNNIIHLDIDKPGSYRYGDYVVKVEEIDRSFIEYNDSCQFLGFHDSPWPLLIRSWNIGDKFKPLGMGGQSQTLKKYFINEKVRLLEKLKIPLLVKENNICSILTKRISEDYKVDENSKYILKITWKNSTSE